MLFKDIDDYFKDYLSGDIDKLFFVADKESAAIYEMISKKYKNKDVGYGFLTTVISEYLFTDGEADEKEIEFFNKLIDGDFTNEKSIELLEKNYSTHNSLLIKKEILENPRLLDPIITLFLCIGGYRRLFTENKKKLIRWYNSLL